MSNTAVPIPNPTAQAMLTAGNKKKIRYYRLNFRFYVIKLTFSTQIHIECIFIVRFRRAKNALPVSKITFYQIIYFYSAITIQQADSIVLETCGQQHIFSYTVYITIWCYKSTIFDWLVM